MAGSCRLERAATMDGVGPTANCCELGGAGSWTQAVPPARIGWMHSTVVDGAYASSDTMATVVSGPSMAATSSRSPGKDRSGGESGGRMGSAIPTRQATTGSPERPSIQMPAFTRALNANGEVLQIQTLGHPKSGSWQRLASQAFGFRSVREIPREESPLVPWHGPCRKRSATRYREGSSPAFNWLGH